MCCGPNRSEMSQFASLSEDRVQIRVAQSSGVSRLHQRAQEDALLLPANPRDNSRGRNGMVRLRHLDPEQYEEAPHLPRLLLVNALRPPTRLILQAPHLPQRALRRG